MQMSPIRKASNPVAEFYASQLRQRASFAIGMTKGHLEKFSVK
jgi:hypothetical protein